MSVAAYFFANAKRSGLMSTAMTRRAPSAFATAMMRRPTCSSERRNKGVSERAKKIVFERLLGTHGPGTKHHDALTRLEFTQRARRMHRHAQRFHHRTIFQTNTFGQLVTQILGQLVVTRECAGRVRWSGCKDDVRAKVVSSVLAWVASLAYFSGLEGDGVTDLKRGDAGAD